MFIVATSNDITSLPPELIRKGRLDEIFFVDLPDQNTRAEIFAIHLAKRSQQPPDFDIHRLAAETDGFSGAEIDCKYIGLNGRSGNIYKNEKKHCFFVHKILNSNKRNGDSKRD